MILYTNLPSSFEAPNSAARALDAIRRERRESSVASLPRNGASYAEIAGQVEGKKPSDLAAPDRETKPADGKSLSLWQNGDFSFGDILDVINPLQHIPIVATIYRNLSGDALGMAPRVLGGALWGRLGGLIAGVANAVVEWFTGKDIGDHVYAFFLGDPKSSSPSDALAWKNSLASGVARGAKSPRVYPASLPRGPRENGLRSDAKPDRAEPFSSLPAAAEAELGRPDPPGFSRYYRTAALDPTAERRSEVQRTA